MPAVQHKLLAWSPERDAALAAWLKRGAELGVSFRAPNGQHSDAAAVGEALRRANACRCEEHREDMALAAGELVVPLPEPGSDMARLLSANVLLRREREDLAKAYAGAAVELGIAGPRVDEPTNPLRALREAAGLSQSQMARKMGVSKRAVQLSEARAVASPDMVERARKALGTLAPRTHE